MVAGGGAGFELGGKKEHVFVKGAGRICCLTSTEASRPIRDGDEWEKGGKKSETSEQASARKTKAAVDRRQNNKMLN